MTDTKLNALQTQATELGLPFHHRLGADKLQALINTHLVANPPTPNKEVVAENGLPDISHLPSTVNLAAVPMSEYEYHLWKKKQARTQVNRLRRIRLQCMNPNKKEWAGEIISTGSAKLGTFKKFIPFNGEPYHVPQIIYDVLKERECTIFITVKSDRPGAPDIRKGKLIKEFAIEDLLPLTEKELDALGKRQALAQAGL